MKEGINLVRKLGIFEVSVEGHHPRYLRWLLESPLSASFDLVVAGPPALLAHPEMLQCKTPFQKVPIVISEKEKVLLKDFSYLGLIRREFVVREVYRKAYQNAKAIAALDAIFLPYVDDCLNAIAVAGSPFSGTPFLGITMHTQFHFPEMGVRAPPVRLSGFRKRLFLRFLNLSTLTLLLTIDPSLMEYAQTAGRKPWQKLRYLADPGETYSLPSKSDARDALGISSEAKVILAYGALTERKGIFTLLEAAADPSCPTDIHLLLGGKQDDALSSFLAGPTGQTLKQQDRLHIVAGYVPSELESSLIAASDCMWVGYKGFYMMSSILVMAGLNGLPSIASEDGLVGFLERKFGLGTTVNPHSVSSTVAGLQRLSDGTVDMPSAGLHGRNAFADHTIKAFGETISKAVFDSVQHSDVQSATIKQGVA